MRVLNSNPVLALGAILVLALLLPWLPLQPRPGQAFDTRGWTPTDFVEHLRQHGVKLHVIPGTSSGSISYDLFLTEDPTASWFAMQRKLRVLEHIQEWRGTVRVWCVHPDCGELVAEWGPYGCRIGHFYLFGDEAILQRIQNVCR